MSESNRQTRRRDREVEAGLAFAWRVPGGSFRRMAVGVLVASGLFAGAASMVRVKGPERRQETREAARVFVLRPDDATLGDLSADDVDLRELIADRAALRELLDWARFHSPFPDRWEPAPEGRLEESMAEVSRYLEDQGAYEARLRPRLVKLEEPRLPGLIGDAPEMSMALEAPGAGARPIAVNLPVKAVCEAVNGLGKRWGRRTADWERDNAAELMGSEARFMVGVTPDGTVEMCMLVDKSRSLSKEADVEMERWIRGQKLAPDPDAEGLVWGMLRIRLEATVVTPTVEEGGVMIEVTVKEFFGGIVLFTFLMAALSVYIDRRRDRKRARAILRGTIRCRVCGRSFLARESIGMEDCPDCGRGNFRGRDRRLG